MTAKVECCCPECGAEFAAKPEGGHRLLCGDSTVATDVERVLGGVAPHLMVTDPPYGVNYDSRQHFPSVAACARPRARRLGKSKAVAGGQRSNGGRSIG